MLINIQNMTNTTSINCLSIEDLKELNQNNMALVNYDYSSNKYIFIESKIIKNFQIAIARQEARDSITTISQGDIIVLPDGQKVFVSHAHSDTVQTTGGGSFYISKGGQMSYSGGLDSGLKISDLIKSEDKGICSCWFFEGDWSRAHSAVYANISVTVWKVKEGADLSGVPQVKRLIDAKYLEGAETITRTDGNGRPYTLPVPKLRFLNLTDAEALSIGNSIGLTLKRLACNVHEVQPLKIKQVEVVKAIKGYKNDFHNGCYYKNTLLFTKIDN
jgi:hypothetical protein